MGTPGKRRVFLDIADTEDVENTLSQIETETKSYPFRIDLKNFIQKIEENTNERVIGLVYDETYTIELLTIPKDRIY